MLTVNDRRRAPRSLTWIRFAVMLRMTIMKMIKRPLYHVNSVYKWKDLPPNAYVSSSVQYDRRHADTIKAASVSVQFRRTKTSSDAVGMIVAPGVASCHQVELDEAPWSRVAGSFAANLLILAWKVFYNKTCSVCFVLLYMLKQTFILIGNRFALNRCLKIPILTSVLWDFLTYGPRVLECFKNCPRCY